MEQKLNKNQLIRQWVRENGGCWFDLKNKDIILYDGAIFSVNALMQEFKPQLCSKCLKKVEDLPLPGNKFNFRTEVKNMNKIMGTVPINNGMFQVQFSKKKVPVDTYQATVWFESIDEVIDYFTKIRGLLHKMGYKTAPEIK